MNVTYQTRIVGRCPRDPAVVDVYDFTLTLNEEWLAVESILSAIAELTREPIYQEHLTGALQERLGGTVTTVGWHSGVRTEATAP